MLEPAFGERCNYGYFGSIKCLVGLRDQPVMVETKGMANDETGVEFGRVKAVLPESEDDIEVDETLDDDDDDSTFIPEEEEDDEDVTDIIGDVSGDEET